MLMAFITASALCLKKPDPYDIYDITSPVHNIYSLFLIGIDLI